MLVVCSGCKNVGTSTHMEENQSIVFIYQQVTYSDIFTNCGFFIDYEGNKFAYDFSEKDKKYVDIDELYQLLLLQKDELQAESYFSQEELNECYELLQEIENEGTCIEGSCSFDRGDMFWYGVRMKDGSDEEIILLERTGDILVSSNEKNIKKLLDILSK